MATRSIPNNSYFFVAWATRSLVPTPSIGEPIRMVSCVLYLIPDCGIRAINIIIIIGEMSTIIDVGGILLLVKNKPKPTSLSLAEESVEGTGRIPHSVNFHFGRERLNHSPYPNNDAQLPSAIFFWANNAAAAGSAVGTKQNNEVDADDTQLHPLPHVGVGIKSDRRRRRPKRTRSVPAEFYPPAPNAIVHAPKHHGPTAIATLARRSAPIRPTVTANVFTGPTVKLVVRRPHSLATFLALVRARPFLSSQPCLITTRVLQRKDPRSSKYLPRPSLEQHGVRGQSIYLQKLLLPTMPSARALHEEDEMTQQPLTQEYFLLRRGEVTSATDPTTNHPHPRVNFKIRSR